MSQRRKNTKSGRQIRRSPTPPVSNERFADDSGDGDAEVQAGYDEEAELVQRIERGQRELERMKQNRLTVRRCIVSSAIAEFIYLRVEFNPRIVTHFKIAIITATKPSLITIGAMIF